MSKGGPWADKEKQEPLDWQETINFGVTKVVEADKERWGKAGISSIRM